jgi:hypothetical protein
MSNSETKADNRITLHYRCRDFGYGVEEGEVTGFWTGEVDTWGKRTFQPDNGKPLYLFADEVVEETDAPPLPTKRAGHTPAPWRVDGSSIVAEWETGEAVQVAVMSYTTWTHGTTDNEENRICNERMRSENVANARLIAAAPLGAELADAIIAAARPPYFEGLPTEAEWAAIVSRARAFVRAEGRPEDASDL